MSIWGALGTADESAHYINALTRGVGGTSQYDVMTETEVRMETGEDGDDDMQN